VPLTPQQRRQCSSNRGHKICKGERCLVIRENMANNNYCMECARLILEKARKELNGLILELEARD